MLIATRSTRRVVTTNTTWVETHHTQLCPLQFRDQSMALTIDDLKQEESFSRLPPMFPNFRDISR